MNKKELDVLEKCFEAEINRAVNGGVGLFQTQSKVAKKLEEEGFLVRDEVVMKGVFPVIIKGYRLTISGNFTYCTSSRCN